jgi:hypothetical protein
MHECHSAQRMSDDSILYHYTSLESLIQIFKSRVLWASNPVYLNDAEELLAGRPQLGRLLKRIAEEIRVHAPNND